jgi:aspartate-semialdehyde dehydrogenase
MTLKKVGFIGWRGMVGSVLMQRLSEEQNWSQFESSFFSTSQVGRPGPHYSGNAPLLDAYNIDELKKMDIIITCQGGDYTNKVYADFRSQGGRAIWVDASSALRMDDTSLLVLDPLNAKAMQEYLSGGGNLMVGSNCTVSLLLMAMGTLIKRGHVDWITSMTYQAASGAGARHMKELVAQMGQIGGLLNETNSALELADDVNTLINSDRLECREFPAALAANLLPWIDRLEQTGQSREEAKATREAQRIMGRDDFAIDGTCVRVGSLRSHAQGLSIMLNKQIPIGEIEAMIREDHAWTRLVANAPEDTVKFLTPAAVSGTLDIAIGRLRVSQCHPKMMNAFTVGDQLLWGAAEPLRRALVMILEN